MRRLVVLIGLLLASACSDVTDVEQPEIERQDGILTSLPPDPCPTCDGHWIGLSNTECLTSLTDDQDGDGFRDLCEQRIAEFFRPLLVPSNTDNAPGHEPYWAVNGDETGASLFWAFAYYFDGGAYMKDAFPSSVYCSTGADNIFEGKSCDGHPGDSESAVINLRYNATSKHWEVSYVLLSRHGAFYSHDRTAMEYAGATYGYPKIYASWGKHANYTTDAACDAGGISGSDECLPTTPVREYYDAYRNLGSSANNLLNCVYSSGSYAGTGRQECFWATTGSFRGWTGLNPTSTVAPYGTIMQSRGF